MIKLTMIVKRLPQMTYEQFDHHWSEYHAPLVASLQDSLNIIRYVQTVPNCYPSLDKIIQTSRQAQGFRFDGMAEIWWKDLEAMQRNRQSTEAIKALNTLIEDEKRFIDHSKSIVWYSTERSIIHNFLS